jgi:hypothetical protein
MWVKVYGEAKRGTLHASAWISDPLDGVNGETSEVSMVLETSEVPLKELDGLYPINVYVVK